MGIKKFKISHQRGKCIGCGFCVSQNPNIWKINRGDNLVDLVNGKKKGNVFVIEVDMNELDINLKIAKLCPMKIIKIYK